MSRFCIQHFLLVVLIPAGPTPPRDTQVVSKCEVTDAQRLFDSISTYPSERISSEQRKNILALNLTAVYLLELALLTSLNPQIIHQKTT